MQTVRELLARRPRHVLTTTRHASVFEALRRMAEHDIGALPVLDGTRLVGILSERDYARGVVLRGRSSRDMTVAELMVAPEVVTPDDLISTCMERMTERRVRHLPVLEDGILIGIVTLGDVVKRFKKVLVPELNTGQLRLLLRGKFLVDARGLNKIQGKPFLVEEIEQAIELMLNGGYGERESMMPRHHHVDPNEQDYDLTTMPEGLAHVEAEG